MQIIKLVNFYHLYKNVFDIIDIKIIVLNKKLV